MNRVKWLALVAVIASGLVFATMMSSCEELKELCGPCGEVENGDTTISGDPALDGLFSAVGNLDANFGRINGDFKAQVMEMAVAFEVDPPEGKTLASMSFEALVDATVAKISADFSADFDGGVSVSYAPPSCEVSVDASFSAQAKCEAKAGCEVDLECSGPELSFECEGKCEGSCEGTCEVPVCKVALEANFECSGECSGGCSLTVDAECNGECRGTCSGECSSHNASGECQGTCSGTCQGECVAEVKGECGGKCEGSCMAEASADVECEGEIACSGSCEGSCSGGCEGTATAPKCEGSAECNASAKCEAQAEAQASASASCQPPRLEVAYKFSASVEGDVDAEAAIRTKMAVFKKGMIGVMQGMVNLRLLVDADAAAEIGIDPPVISIGAEFVGLVDAIVDGEFKVVAGLIPCATTAVETSITMLADFGAKVTGTVTAQLKFAALIGLD